MSYVDKNFDYKKIINNEDRWDIFIISTYASSIGSSPIYHSSHRLLELRCIHVRTNSTFHALCIPTPDFEIPLSINGLTGITTEKLRKSGYDTDEVMENFYNWVTEKSRIKLTVNDEEEEKIINRTPIFVTHNGTYVKDLILKEMRYVMDVGRNGVLLGWIFFCTLESIKNNFPEIEYLDSNIDQPYSLKNLTKLLIESEIEKTTTNDEEEEESLLEYENDENQTSSSSDFTKSSMSSDKLSEFYECILESRIGYHNNIEYTCDITAYLFLKVLLPKEINNLLSTNWNLCTFSLDTYREINEDGEILPPILKKISEVKWLKMYRTEQIVEGRIVGGQIVPGINTEFTKIPNDYWNRFACTENLIDCSYLMQYGWMLTCRKQKKLDEEMSPQEEWYWIIRYIELYFRTKLQIYNDSIILEPLQYILNAGMNEIVNHMVKDDDITPLFPSMPGDPISYLPLELTPAASQQLYNGTGYGTIYEMILGYDTKSCTDDEWFSWITSKLNPDHHKSINKPLFMKIYDSSDVIVRFKKKEGGGIEKTKYVKKR